MTEEVTTKIPRRLCCFQLSYEAQRVIVLACQAKTEERGRYYTKSEFLETLIRDWAELHMPEALSSG